MIYAVIVFLGVVADQLSKMWAVEHLMSSSPVVVPGVLSFTYVENTGMAFGMGSGMTLFLAIASLVLALVLAFMLVRYREKMHALSKVALSLMIAGALGNVIDRFFLGYVVDFIRFDFVEFAVFNVADICVTMGTIFLFLSLIFLEFQGEGKRAVAEGEKTDGAADKPGKEEGEARAQDRDSEGKGDRLSGAD